MCRRPEQSSDVCLPAPWDGSLRATSWKHQPIAHEGVRYPMGIPTDTESEGSGDGWTKLDEGTDGRGRRRRAALDWAAVVGGCCDLRPWEIFAGEEGVRRRWQRLTTTRPGGAARGTDWVELRGGSRSGQEGKPAGDGRSSRFPGPKPGRQWQRQAVAVALLKPCAGCLQVCSFWCSVRQQRHECHLL